MDINRSRIQLLTTTGVLFVFAILVVVLFVRQINIQSVQLQEQVAAVEADQQQQAQLTQARKLIADTQAERGEISGYYLASESDSIEFLNYIESLADAQTITLKTISAQRAEEEDSALRIQYVIQGSKADVTHFIQLLELVPYVSHLSNIQLTRRSVSEWEANVTITVSVLEYETET